MTPCPDCGGSGKVWSFKKLITCRHCSGNGIDIADKCQWPVKKTGCWKQCEEPCAPDSQYCVRHTSNEWLKKLDAVQQPKKGDTSPN